MLSAAVEDLTLVDTVMGARLELKNGDTVFPLIPRKCAIERVTMPGDVVSSLHALENSTTASEVRGKNRIPVAEDDAKYVTVGLKPNRGLIGITETWPRKLSQVVRGNVRKLMATSEEVAKGFISSNELRGLRNAQLFTKVATVERSYTTTYLGKSCLWQKLLSQLPFR